MTSIVVDTSAMMAVALGEPAAERCREALDVADEIAISAGTLAELLVVANLRGVADKVRKLVDGLAMEVVPVDGTMAEKVGEAYRRWGKGVHPAGLNLGDCFAYALAEYRGSALLFVGNDFSRTDIPPAP